MATPNRTLHPEIERNAYNMAFMELGLDWSWDAKTYQAIFAEPAHGFDMGRYLRTHHPYLLRAYDVDFLVSAIEALRSQTLAQSALESA